MVFISPPEFNYLLLFTLYEKSIRRHIHFCLLTTDKTEVTRQIAILLRTNSMTEYAQLVFTNQSGTADDCSVETNKDAGATIKRKEAFQLKGSILSNPSQGVYTNVKNHCRRGNSQSPISIFKHIRLLLFRHNVFFRR
jgi:hypothetical protein